MRRCTDCFHYKACLRFFESSTGRGLPSNYMGGNADRCEDFVSAADVAPRAEVERLEQICNSYALQYGTVRDQLPIIKRIGVDAAREIFEAIGAVMKAHSIGDIDDHTLYVYIHTLKEKYTEEQE